MNWYFVLLCVLVIGSDGLGMFYASVKGNLIDSSFVPKIGEAGTKETNIMKRGIVLVDEDFDVPSAIYAHENKSRTGVNLNTDVFVRNEGSGGGEFDEKELTATTKETIFTNQEKELTTTTKEIFTHNEKVLTSSTKEVMFTYDKEELTKATKEMVFTHASSTKQSISVLPTKEVKSTDLESSGDDILITTKGYVVTEMTTSVITEPVHKEIPDICMNSTCSHDDLSVSLSEDKNLMAEGTNLSLWCKSNNSDHNMLYWYKSNGTVYFLQSFGVDNELQFNIPDTKSFHSGMYKCVKWVNAETCCNLKLDLSVYELPLYKYHLIILGLIVAACLIICLFFSVRQTLTLRIYTKQFVEKHDKGNEQLL